MRLLTKALMALFPALILAGGSAQAANESWRQSCVGPDLACSAPAVVAPVAKAKPAKSAVKAKKTSPVASEDTASKPKKKKKIAKVQVDDEPVAKPKKKVAKVQPDDDEPVAKPKKVKKRVAKAQDDEPVAKPKKKAKVASKSSGGGEWGVASWYGGYFHGRTTANGEKYNMWAMTAAHKTLPFGTKVLVTNQNNGNTVVVRINDRGPFIKGRIIDLSKAAANDIGMSGIAPVKVTVLGKG